MPPGDAYWAFFHAKRGGSWVYSSSGVASYDPAPGTVVGFRFGSGQKPRVAPPDPTKTSAPAPTATTSKPKPTTSKPRPTTSAPKATTPKPRRPRGRRDHLAAPGERHAVREQHGIRLGRRDGNGVGDPQHDGIRDRRRPDLDRGRRRRRRRPGHPHRRRGPRGARRRWGRLGRLEATRLTR